MNNLPEKIKIGGITYTIRFIPDEELSENNNCGKLDRDKDEILIGESLSLGNKLLSFLHEMVHAINGELEEEEVESIAVGLHQVLVDNELL